MPLEWSDVGTADPPLPSHSGLASLSGLLRLRAIANALLQRLPAAEEQHDAQNPVDSAAAQAALPTTAESLQRPLQRMGLPQPHRVGWPPSAVSSRSSSSGRARAWSRAKGVACSNASKSNGPRLRQALTITLGSRAASAWTPSSTVRIVFFRHVGRLLQILDLRRAQLADPLDDRDELGAEPLEPAEGGHFALGLVDLGGTGERLLDGLTVMLDRRDLPGAVARMIVLGADAVGLAAAAAVRDMDGIEPEIAQPGDFEQDLRAA